MLKRNLHYILLLLLIANSLYFFSQFYHTPLDGDMADGILPSEGSSYVLNDPFGLSVLFHNKIYANPNRFFAHWFMTKYFKTAPFLLQNFVSPINSIYLSFAVIKTAIELFIIYLLASLISLSGNIFRKEFLIVAILVAPLIQVNGYNREIGIIDQSITYTLFYALPFSLLMFFFYIFYRSWQTSKAFKFNYATRAFLFLFPVVLTLSGPLVPPTVLIVCPLVLGSCFFSNYKNSKGKLWQRVHLSVNEIPKPLLFYFIWICLCSSYSFYIGLNELQNFGLNAILLLNRYLLMLQGIAFLFQGIGVPLLLSAVILNGIIIRIWFYDGDGKKNLQLYKWVGIFIVIYILLLPFGGYRPWRPYIIRYDTIIPITIALLFIYGLSTYFLMKNIKNKIRYVYTGALVVFLLIFKMADKPLDNNCEKQALKQIANSPDKIVLLNCDCTVMTWFKITDYHNSELNGELFQYWGITKEKKLYYQK